MGRARRRQRGAILFDALIGTGILGMGGFAIVSMLPTLQQGQAYAAQQTRACQMATRMAEDLQMLPTSSLNGQTLIQLNLIDSNQNGPILTFSHVALDESARYSPATALPDGTGTIELTKLAGGSVMAKVVVTWRSPYGQRTYETGTVVGGYR